MALVFGTSHPKRSAEISRAVKAGNLRKLAPKLYMSVLEALTLNGNPNPYVAFAHKLIDFNSRMPLTSFEESYEHFKKTGALDEPTNSNFSLHHLM